MPIRLLLSAAMLALAGPLVAATVTVTNLQDSGAGSLRDALQTASNGDDIVFQAGLTGTIPLLSELVLDKYVNILGPATGTGIVVSGQGAVRCINITVPVVTSISHLTIANGMSTSEGGGIRVAGTWTVLHLQWVTVRDCQSSFRGSGVSGNTNTAITATDCQFLNNSPASYGTHISATGGELQLYDCLFEGHSTIGVYRSGINMLRAHRCVFSGNGGNGLHVHTGHAEIQNCTFRGGGLTLIATPVTTSTISGCTFHSNSMGQGSGLYFDSLGSAYPTTGPSVVNLLNCTFSGIHSSATVQGAAIHVDFPSQTSHPHHVNLVNCTLTGNTASGTSGQGTTISVHGVSTSYQTLVTFKNTIISGPGTSNIGTAYSSAGVTFTSLDNNICSDGTGNLTGPNDKPFTNPQLGPLQDNGGYTLTHAPLPGSPAVDGGQFVPGLTTDQRGLSRPVDESSIANPANGDGTDIGAVEVRAQIAVYLQNTGTVALANPQVVGGINVGPSGRVLTFHIANRVSALAWLVLPTNAVSQNVTVGVGTVNSGLTQPMHAILVPGADTTFSVTIMATGAATGAPYTLELQIASNDPDDNPFTIYIAGSAFTNDPGVLTTPTGSAFVLGTDFGMSVAPGVALANAVLTASDPTPDPLNITTAFFGGPQGGTPPAGINPPANLTGITAFPYPLAWSGTPDPANEPGTYVWIVTLADGTSNTSYQVRIEILDLAPGHTPFGATPGTGILMNPYAVWALASTSPTWDIATLADPNSGQTVTLTGAAAFSRPPGSAASFTFLLGAGTSSRLLSAYPALPTVLADLGVHVWVVTFTDGTHVVSLYVEITITGMPPAMVSAPAPNTAAVGIPYTHVFVAAGHPTAFTWSIVPITPAWLTLNSATGELSGTPGVTDVGTYTMAVLASNGLYPDAMEVLVLHVGVPAPPAFVSSHANSVTAGQSYFEVFQVTGFPTPVISLTGGTLPAWLTFNSATGMLYGTPAGSDVGTTGLLTFTAANGAGPDAILAFSITVFPAPSGGSASGPTEDEKGCTARPGAGLAWFGLLLLGAAARLRRRAT